LSKAGGLGNAKGKHEARDMPGGENSPSNSRKTAKESSQFAVAHEAMINRRLSPATYQRLHHMALWTDVDAIAGADAVVGEPTTPKDLLGDLERGRLDPKFDAHLGPPPEGIARRATGQQTSAVGA